MCNKEIKPKINFNFINIVKNCDAFLIHAVCFSDLGWEKYYKGRAQLDIRTAFNITLY